MHNTTIKLVRNNPLKTGKSINQGIVAILNLVRKQATRIDINN